MLKCLSTDAACFLDLLFSTELEYIAVILFVRLSALSCGQEINSIWTLQLKIFLQRPC